MIVPAIDCGRFAESPCHLIEAHRLLRVCRITLLYREFDLERSQPAASPRKKMLPIKRYETWFMKAP